MSGSVPVTILTGFLGSGKTTLLNALLKAPSLADTAVIVNEFGEVGIDHMLIESAIENTVLLKNGCVCCTVRGDVADTLKQLWEQREAGSIPHFRRIVIETTGLADPGPVAHTIAAEGAGYNCRLDGIVTTVDAVHGTQQLERQEEAQKQVALADRVVLTKTDLASPESASRLISTIRRLNDDVPVQHVSHGATAPDTVFDIGPSADSPDRTNLWLRVHAHEAAGRPEDRHRSHGHGDADHHLHPFMHDHEIHSVVIRHPEPIAWECLTTWLESILSLRGDRILRLKGLVRLSGFACPTVVQGVHHVLHPLVQLPQWPLEKPQTMLVLIVRGLPADGLRESFAAAVGREPSDPASSPVPRRDLNARTRPDQTGVEP